MKTGIAALALLFALAVPFSGFAQEDQPQEDVPGSPAAAVEFTLQLRSGLHWQGQSEGTTGDPESGDFPNGISTSQWFNHGGVGLIIGIQPFLNFSPSLDFYVDEYIFLEEYGRAFITQAQTGSSLGPLATVLVVQLNLPWMMRLPLSENAGFDFAAGININLRIPAFALDGTSDTGPIASYLLGGGRFLNLYLEPGFSFGLSESIGFSLAVRSLLPVWQLWDPAGSPFWDSLYAGLVLGITFNL